VTSLAAPSGRAVNVRYIEPENCQACPLIIFSHGANATYNRYDRYLLPLSGKGYRIVAPNHVDSEAHPNRDDYSADDYLPTRMEDYELIAEHYKPSVLIAAGHSFGALIAQLAGGAQTTNNNWASNHPPDAIIALSPPGAIDGYITKQDWAGINRPHLVVTGTDDVVLGIADTWQAHLVSYHATRAGLAFALIYNGMNHYMNGAYGRQNAQASPARLAATSHLVDASDAFLEAILGSKGRSAKAWNSQSADFVSAMSK